MSAFLELALLFRAMRVRQPAQTYSVRLRSRYAAYPVASRGMEFRMSTKASATATVQSWDEAPYDEAEGTAKTSKARITYQYEGDLTGEGISESVMVYVGQEAEYVGLERITATIDGHSGTFVVSIKGGFHNGVASWSWEVVPGSASGELEGLRASGNAEAPSGNKASLTFDYDLG
jgi:hypothetical protein